MKKIATLGPQQTFSDLAAGIFVKELSASEIRYHNSINQIFETVVAGDADFGVIPIENVLAGFVQPTLDSLVRYDVTILQELLLPVRFSCIGHTKELGDIKQLYVQPVAKGQCENFINSLDTELIETSSNIESYHKYLKMSGNIAAIVPHHILADLTEQPVLSVEDVTDYAHNQTRFIVIAQPFYRQSSQKNETLQKTSVIIRDESDHSGILSDITHTLAHGDINMLSIISRPTRESMGKYYFFIDLDGDITSEKMQQALNEISKKYVVKLLGSYTKVDLNI